MCIRDRCAAFLTTFKIIQDLVDNMHAVWWMTHPYIAAQDCPVSIKNPMLSLGEKFHLIIFIHESNINRQGVKPVSYTHLAHLEKQPDLQKCRLQEAFWSFAMPLFHRERITE